MLLSFTSWVFTKSIFIFWSSGGYIYEMQLNGPRKKPRCLTMKSKFETVFWKCTEMFPKYREDQNSLLLKWPSRWTVSTFWDLCGKYSFFFISTLPLGDKNRFLGCHSYQNQSQYDFKLKLKKLAWNIYILNYMLWWYLILILPALLITDIFNYIPVR